MTSISPPTLLGRRILRPENAGWRWAFNDGKFASQLALDQWRPWANEAPDLRKGVTQFFMVDGPVTPTAAAEVDAAVGDALEKPLVVFLYTNWEPVSAVMAPEYKEAAYTVKEAEYKADFEAVDCDEPASAALCAPPILPDDYTVPGLVIYHKGDAARRAISVGDMAEWVGVRAQSGVWVAAARMTSWIKDELNKYQADDSPEMVTVEVDVDVPEGGEGEEGGDDGQQQQQQHHHDGDGGGDGHHFDDFSGEHPHHQHGGGDGHAHHEGYAHEHGGHHHHEHHHGQHQQDDGGHAAQQQPPSEAEQQPAGGEPEAASESNGGGASYSFTPVAAPDPDYEPTPEPQSEEEEAAEYAARREAWEAAEGVGAVDRGGGVLYEGGDGGDPGDGGNHVFHGEGAEPEEGYVDDGSDGEVPPPASEEWEQQEQQLGIGANGHVGDAPDSS